MEEMKEKLANVPGTFNEVKKKSSGFIGEFKKFALRGNVIDLAVGVIIGAAFNNIVQSLVKDIITPPIGLITNNIDFSKLQILLSSNPDGPAIRYGVFFNNLIQFLITALAIFVIIKQINRFTQKEKEKEKPSVKDCPYCFSTINAKATKCPECTADIPADLKKKEKKSVKIPKTNLLNKD